MFPTRFFNPRFWARRFWPRRDGTPTAEPGGFLVGDVDLAPVLTGAIECEAGLVGTLEAGPVMTGRVDWDAVGGEE